MEGNNTSISAEVILATFSDKNFTLIGLYVPVFLAAVISNTIVILVVFKGQYMRSVTNYFLVNLSIADLFVTLLCMPNAAWLAYTTIYHFGEYTCKVTEYLQCVSVASSIFTITAMALDRYLAIAKPFGMVYKRCNKSTTIIVIITLWFTSMFLFFPMLWVYKLHTDQFPFSLNNGSISNVAVVTCRQDWSNSVFSQYTLGIVWFTFMFAVPGFIILFAYSMMGRTLCSGIPAFDNDSSCTQQRNRVIRDRKRVACILLLLAFLFALCWLPYHIVILLADVAGSSESTEYEEEESVKPITLRRYLLLVGHANSALNPIIYCALSKKFRNSIKNLFCVEVSFRRRRQLVKWQDSSGSGTQMHYIHRTRTAPSAQNHIHLQPTVRSRYQSSQKTSKTAL